MNKKKVCVFCGSSRGVSPLYMKTAVQLGRELGLRGIGLVYGGAQIGLMGALADGALMAGAEVIGVIPEGLVDKEVAHSGLNELKVVKSMHERKAVMADLADAFIALPGGFGTLDELCEIITWRQLNLHQKPIGLLNAINYFTPFLDFVDLAVREEFIAEDHRHMLVVEENPVQLLDRLLI